MGSNGTVACFEPNDEQLLVGQAHLSNLLYAYADSLVVKAAVELRLADVIHAHGKPMSLTQIAAKIESPSPDVAGLGRLLRVLVRKQIFTIEYTQSPEKEALYGPTAASKWLLHDNDLSLAQMFITWTHPWIMAPWHKISQAIKEGGTSFEKAYGMSFWEKGATDPEFNKLHNAGMVSATKPTLEAIVTGYKDGFAKLNGTVVDVGGGMGRVIAEIVRAHPHIKGINYDLPHVVEGAPQYPGVTHVGGDIFKEIPAAETVFIKSVLHDWGDEDCVKILKNCQKAVSAKNGKVIIVDPILDPQGKGLFDDFIMALDILLMACSVHGKERTKDEWEKLLKESGFKNYNIIKLPSLMSIIEAYP